MRKFLTFLFGAVLALCFLGCPNTAGGGATSGNGGSNSTSGKNGGAEDPFNEPITPPETDIENLSEEDKTLLKDILTSLKTDPIYTDIPYAEKPDLDSAKVNFYKNKISQPTNNQPADHVLLLATPNNKVISYYVKKDNDNFKFYDLFSYIENDTENMSTTTTREINEFAGINILDELYILNEVMYLSYNHSNIYDKTCYLKLSTVVKQISQSEQLFLTVNTQKLNDKIKLKSRLVAEFDYEGQHYSIDETMDEWRFILNNKLYEIHQDSDRKKYDFWGLLDVSFKTKTTTSDGKRQVIQYDPDGVEIIEDGETVCQRIWTEEEPNVWIERNGLWDPKTSTSTLTILEGDFYNFYSKVVDAKIWE